MISWIVFIFGAIAGSFLNVCIHRMPKEESVVTPGSHCVHCKAPVVWYDNIPLLSFIALRGSCRACRKKISPRYFMVELINALLWVFLWNQYGFTGHFFTGAVLFSILLAVTVTDMETGLIPDALSIPGIFIGLVCSALVPAVQDKVLWYDGFFMALLGFLAGGLILISIGMLGSFLYKKETMGGGDIKLLAMLGAFLGIHKIFAVFFVSPFIALPFALYVKFVKKGETIAYGPYIAIAGAWAYVYGKSWMEQFFAYSYF